MMRWIRGSTSLLPFGLLGLALGCTSTQIQPGEPTISSPAPVVSVRGGEALAAWHRSGKKLWVSSAFVGTTAWSTPIMIGSGDFPEVALSTSGVAFIIYAGLGVGAGPRPTNAMVRTANVWGAPTTLDLGSGGFGWYRAVAADATGNALAVWSNSGIRASVYQSGVGWRPTTTISSVPSGVSPKVAMTETGAGIAGWCDAGRVYAASYDRETGWGAPVSTGRTDCCIGTTDVISPGVSVTISETGAAYALGASGSVCVVSREAGASWTWTTLGDTGYLSSPQIAASLDGRVIAAWMHRDVGGGSRSLKVRALSPSAGWGPTLTGPSGLGAGPMGIGYGSTGHAAVTFKLASSMNYVTYDAASGTLSSPTTFTAAGAVPYYLRTAFNPLESAQGVSVWQQNGSEEIWGSRLGI